MKNINAIGKIISQLNLIFTAKQKRGAVIVFICMMLCTMLELLGVSAIYPFLQLMVDETALKNKWYIRMLYKINPEISFNQLIIYISIGIAVIYLIKNAVALLCSYLQNRYSAQLLRELSTLMLDSYMCRPYEFFVNSNSSIILRGVLDDTGSVHVILLCLFVILSQIFTVLALGIYLVIQDIFISVGIFCVMLVCFIGTVKGFKGIMKRAGKIQRESMAEEKKCVYQAINGIKEITVADRRDNFVRKFEEAAKRKERTTYINNFVTDCPDRILEGVCVAGFMGVICIRVLLSTEDINTFIPVLGTFAMSAFKILPCVSKISSRLNNMVYYQPGLENCCENIVEARKFLESNCVEAGKDTRENREKLEFKSSIEMKNISWRYMNSTENVLEGLSLSIKRGESIGLIGSSGAGKTTLSDIFMGLLKPQEGMVTIDGTDIFSRLHQWSKIIGYVPQVVYLIDDTVRANVAFGISEELVSDKRVWEALKQAQLDKFIRGLPQGLDTIVGERGIKFSGGQRQRIAIARALYDDPEILILDEATAALDNETETAVMEAINNLQGKKTMIIVAHRLTTIQRCDKIYEIGEGIATLKNWNEIMK